MKRFLGVLLTLVLTACATPTPSGPAQIDPPFPAPGPVGARPRIYAVESGWVNGQKVNYYNLGTNTPLDPIDPSRVLVEGAWVFVTGENPDGSPIKVEGQGTVFDAIPGDATYSDLWQIFFVSPPADYAPGSITSLAQLQASGLPIEKKPMLVNCPIVPPDSRLEDEVLKLAAGVVRGEPVVYFDFGPTSATPGKVYAFVTGFDAQGRPQLVPGQHFVFSAQRGNAGYSDFWEVYWVVVGADYVADSVTSEADITATQEERSGLIVNYPHKQP
jgi:hypothetical protein